MEVNTQAVLEEILEQNKQLTLQMAIARTMINQLQQQVQELMTQAEESK